MHKIQAVPTVELYSVYFFPKISSFELMSTKCFSAKVPKAGIYQFGHHI